MSVFLRYLGIVLAVLVIAIVFTMCGEGACEACMHACCMRSDRVDRVRAVWSRVFDAYRVCTGDARAAFGWATARAQCLLAELIPPFPLAERLSPLRI